MELRTGYGREVGGGEGRNMNHVTKEKFSYSIKYSIVKYTLRKYVRIGVGKKAKVSEITILMVAMREEITQLKQIIKELAEERTKNGRFPQSKPVGYALILVLMDVVNLHSCKI